MKVDVSFKLEHIDIEINHRCNLACRHCSALAGRDLLASEELSVEEIKNIMYDAQTIGLKKVGFTGGEPFIDIPKLRELAEFCWNELGIPLHTHTNGTLINEEICKDKELLDSFESISVTFLGGKPESHDYITNTQGSYNGSFNGARLLTEYGHPLVCYFIPTHGVCEEFKELAIRLGEVGVRRIRAMALAPSGRARPIYGQTAPLKHELDKFADDLFEINDKYGITIEAGYCTRLSIPNFTILAGHEVCTSAENRVHINSKGNVFPCTAASGVQELCLGNIKNSITKLSEIWQNSKIIDHIRLMHRGQLTECENCPRDLKCQDGCMVNALGTMKEDRGFKCAILN